MFRIPETKIYYFHINYDITDKIYYNYEASYLNKNNKRKIS